MALIFNPKTLRFEEIPDPVVERIPENGRDGINGIDGKDGKDGAVGPQGPQGIQGEQGPAGKDGLDGKDGKNGKNGKDGVSLEYKWDGTKLGIKREDELGFTWTDLRGQMIISGGSGGGRLTERELVKMLSAIGITIDSNGYVNTNSLYTGYLNVSTGADFSGDIIFASSPQFQNDSGIDAAFFVKSGPNGNTGMIPDPADGAEKLNFKIADRDPAIRIERNSNDSADGVIIGGPSGNLYGDSVLDVTGPVRMAGGDSFFSTGGLAGGYSLYVSSSAQNKFGIADSSDSAVFQILGNSSDYNMIMRIGNIEFDGDFYFEVDQANYNTTVVGGNMRAERMYLRDQINGDYAGITHEDEGYIFNNSSLGLAAIQAGVSYLYGVYADGGTASGPAYSRQTDTNTGIYFPAADQLGISCGGSLQALFTTSGITLSEGKNFAIGTTTGTKIGTGNTQKIGFWNATPIVQPTTSTAAATFVANAGTAVNDASTFDGYTLGKVVKALRNAGILA